MSVNLLFTVVLTLVVRVAQPNYMHVSFTWITRRHAALAHGVAGGLVLTSPCPTHFEPTMKEQQDLGIGRGLCLDAFRCPNQHVHATNTVISGTV